MQTYLKTKPFWIQLALFLGMAFGLFAIFMGFAVLLLPQITGVSLLDLSNSAGWKAGDPAIAMSLRIMILVQFLGMFLIPSLLYSYFADPHPARYLGLQKPSKAIYWFIGIAAMLVAIPLVEYTGILNQKIPVSKSTYDSIQQMEQSAAKTIQVMLGNHTIGNLFINLIFISLFAGIGEELFFRGILQRLLIKAFKNPWMGIVVAAAAFSFFHFQFFGFVPRFLLGILLGAIYWYSGSLWPAIIAHFLYDGFIIVLAYFNPKMIENPDASVFQNTGSLAIMALISAALTIGLLLVMKRNSSASYEAVYADDTPKPSENDLSF